MQRVGSCEPQCLPGPISLESGVQPIKQELTKQDVLGIISAVLEARAARGSRILPLVFTPELAFPGRNRLLLGWRCLAAGHQVAGWAGSLRSV